MPAALLQQALYATSYYSVDYTPGDDLLQAAAADEASQQ